jgi:hypothetical protein
MTSALYSGGMNRRGRGTWTPISRAKPSSWVSTRPGQLQLDATNIDHVAAPAAPPADRAQCSPAQPDPGHRRAVPGRRRPRRRGGQPPARPALAAVPAPWHRDPGAGRRAAGLAEGDLEGGSRPRRRRPDAVGRSHSGRGVRVADQGRSLPPPARPGGPQARLSAGPVDLRPAAVLDRFGDQASIAALARNLLAPGVAGVGPADQGGQP